MEKNLVDAIVEMNEQEAYKITSAMLDAGEDPLKVLELCREAMTQVGHRFEKGEYFLPELILSGEMLKQIVAITQPRLEKESQIAGKRMSRVVIGTVKGDVHDIGKNIVTFMLDVNRIEVHDLGIDVPAERFVEAIQQEKPDVVGLSGFLTIAFESMKETVGAIEKAGLRDQVKIMVGGGMVDEHIRAYAGADAYGADAMAAVSLVEQWTGKE